MKIRDVQSGLTPEPVEAGDKQASAESGGAENFPEEAVSRLRQAAVALAECESRFQTAQRIADLGSWERDLSTNQIQTSEGFRRIFGVDIQKPIYTYETLLKLIHPEDREFFLETTKEVLRDKKSFNLDYRIIRPDETVRTIQVRGEVISDESGAALKIRGVAQDITERRLAEEKLRASQRQYELLVESIDGIVWEADAKTFKFTFISKKAERILGYPLDRWFNEPNFWAEHLHPDDRETALSVCQETTDRRLDHQFEYRMVAADGRLVWLRDIVTVHVMEDHSVRLRGVKVDITERRQAEETLRKAEERFRALVEHSADGVTLINSEGVILYASPATKRIFGLTPEEVRTRRFDLIHPDDLDGVMKAWNRLRTTPGELLSYQYRFRHKDGIWRWLDVTAHSLLSDPSVQAVVVNFRDITERKRAEQAVKFQAHLLDTVEQAAIATDLEGNIIYWNKFAEELYGWSPAEVMGRNILEVTPTQATREQASAIMSSLREGKSWSGEFPAQRRDGKTFPAMVTDSPIYDDQGKLVGIVGISFDATEFKRAEDMRRMLLQRLFTTQEEERHRIARELHDQMGQYLAALMMGLKSLERSAEVTSPVRSRLIKLQELTTQFSQEVRRFALELRPAALDDLGLYAALTNYLEGWSKRNEIKIDFHSNGLTSRRLPAQIETIVYRLVQEALNNVLKHAQARHMSVIVEYRDGRVLVVLEDDGVGFDVEAAIKAPVPERGLGLTGMLERVESARGTLEIESEPGRGTTIVARIPVTSS